MQHHHETHLKRNSDGPKHWILPVSLPLDGFLFAAATSSTMDDMTLPSHPRKSINC